jgi:hypothetical protein
LPRPVASVGGCAALEVALGAVRDDTPAGTPVTQPGSAAEPAGGVAGTTPAAVGAVALRSCANAELKAIAIQHPAVQTSRADVLTLTMLLFYFLGPANKKTARVFALAVLYQNG